MQLLKHFHKLSLHPKNAKELKGLILQLAVQGKLTADWRQLHSELISGSHSAENLLKNITAKKTKQVKEKKIRKERSVLPISKEEIPFELPKDWLWCRLIYLSNINGGFAFKSSNYIENGARVIRISDFDERGFKNHRIVYHKYSDDLKPYILENNNILLAMTGGTVGKSYFVKNVDEKMVVNQRVATIKICSPIFESYINCVIPTSLIQNVISESKNSTNDNISMSDIKNFLIPLPSREEQKEIVKVVETLFKEVEQLESLTEQRVQLKQNYVTSALNQLTTQDTQANWEAIKPYFTTFFDEGGNIKKLRETILQLAVQGKLTRKWRAQNPKLISGANSAEKLLEQIKTEKAQLIKEKKIRKEKTLPPITKEEIPYELPEGWVWCRFQKLILDIEAGKSPKCYPEEATLDKWGVIKMSAISWGRFNPKENKALPLDSEIFVDKEIKTGDFILSRANTSDLIAKSVIVPIGVRSKLLLNDKTLRMRFNHLISKEYLNLYNNGNEARIHYKKVSSGTSESMQNISRHNIKLLMIPLPASEEQKVIVEKVNTLMSLCDELEKEIKTGETQIENLMQSVLREVFEGKKVEEEALPLAAEPGAVYESDKNTIDSLFESLNYDCEVAAVVWLTQQRFGHTYGKKYIHKMFSNIDFLNELPVFNELQFKENGWGMYSPILQKTIENEVLVEYKKLDNGKKTLRVKPKAIPQTTKWIKNSDNKEFVGQVNHMLNIYEKPLIERRMDRIELLNTILECMLVLETNNLKTIRTKMQSWRMREGSYKTKSDKFTENETSHMVHFITGLK